MGTYLSTPVLDKCWEEGEDFDSSTPVAWGVVDMQGWRKTMEDAHIVQTNVPPPNSTKDGGNDKGTPDQSQMFAVFDGHGGAEVARFCQLYMVDVMTRQQEWIGENTEVDVGKALINCFHCIDDLLRDQNRREEIHLLKMNKPNYSERRTIIGTSTVQPSENEIGYEEKEMEETRISETTTAAETESETETENGSQEDKGIDSKPSEDSNTGELHDTISVDEGSGSDPENEATIDISAESLFSRLLTITNKSGASSGTIPLNVAAPADAPTEDNNANQVITPTIVQNGRPVCNLPDHPIHAGCTSVCAVISGKTLTVANAGDSRVVLCRKGGVTEPMSYDHKPMHETEMNRITNAGGFVNQFGRVNGNLNLSRSIGDLKYKQMTSIPPAGQMITAEPDIKQVELQDDDEFIILACDGIWDCLTNEEAVKFVRDRIDESTPTEIGVEMLDKIVSRDPRETQGIGGDNMTVMIVDLLPNTRSYRNGNVAQVENKSDE